MKRKTLLGGGILKRSDPVTAPTATGGVTRTRSTHPRQDPRSKRVLPLNPATPVVYRRNATGWEPVPAEEEEGVKGNGKRNGKEKGERKGKWGGGEEQRRRAGETWEEPFNRWVVLEGETLNEARQSDQMAFLELEAIKVRQRMFRSKTACTCLRVCICFECVFFSLLCRVSCLPTIILYV